MKADTSILAAFMVQRTLAAIDEVTAKTDLTESMAVAATLHAAIRANVARIGARKTAQWLRSTAKQIDQAHDQYEAQATARRALRRQVEVHRPGGGLKT